MDSNAKRLAELIQARQKAVVEEKDRRKEFKDLLEVYDADIARLAESISSGQGELFDEVDR